MRKQNHQRLIALASHLFRGSVILRRVWIKATVLSFFLPRFLSYSRTATMETKPMVVPKNLLLPSKHYKLVLCFSNSLLLYLQYLLSPLTRYRKPYLIVFNVGIINKQKIEKNSNFNNFLDN